MMHPGLLSLLSMKYQQMKKQILALIMLSITLLSFSQTGEVLFRTNQIFNAPEARQGVAVDGGYFYAINSKAIGKYNKKTGDPILVWRDTTGKIIHLDGGVAIKDKLYCAHSNYPGIPMTSSIEIFMVKDLSHAGTHSFGVKYGSCTWADFYRGHWWVCFGNYEQFKEQTGFGSGGTILVKFDRDWNEKGSWKFPENVISEIRPMSVSGGSWGPGGKLYVTGHDSAKVYILRLPRSGSVLEYAGSAKIASHGQGIAWDRSGKNRLYGIIRKDNSVVVSVPPYQPSPGGWLRLWKGISSGTSPNSKCSRHFRHSGHFS